MNIWDDSTKMDITPLPMYPDSIGIPGLISIFSVPWIISIWKIGYFLPFSPIYRRSAIFMEKEPLFASVSFARNRISSGRNCESVRALNFGRRRLRESLFPSRDRWLTRLSWSGRSLLKDETQFFPHFPPSDNKKCTSNRSCYFLPALQRSENFRSPLGIFTLHFRFWRDRDVKKIFNLLGHQKINRKPAITAVSS